MTDYFSIEGYKKVIEYQKAGRCKDVLFFPNVEFRVDTIVYKEKDTVPGRGRRLNLHVLFSPDVPIREIEEDFLHNLEFVYEQDPYDRTYTMKLKQANLEAFGKRLRSGHDSFLQYSELYVGCMNAVVKTDQIKDLLQTRFKGKCLIVLAQQDLSLLDWDSQNHAQRKQLMQLSHALFSSNEKDRKFCLGLVHKTKSEYLKEFIYFKPCIWGSDAHDFSERFLRPTTEAGETRYCWLKCEPTWEGLMQILYEPEERVRIQEGNPETTKSIYTLSSFSIQGTTVNNRLKISQTDLSLNPNLVAIIGGRGSGKTALLDLIASSFREGEKLAGLESSFFHRLFSKGEPGKAIPTSLKFASGDTFNKQIGGEMKIFDRANIIYLTQNHFDEYSSNPKKLLAHIIDLVFERFSDKRREYDSVLAKVNSNADEIQSANLILQQLRQDIESKDSVVAQLKIKEGEKIDIEEKIRKTETRLNVKNEAINKSATEVTELKRQVLLLDGLEAKLSELEEISNEFQEGYSSRAKELSANLQLVFGNEHAFLFGADLFNDAEIQTRIRTNRTYINEKRAECSRKIEGLEQLIATFEGGNKVIAELHQSKTIILGEVDVLNASVDEIVKKEKRIDQLEAKRQTSLIAIIQGVVDARDFLNSMVSLFEAGKNSILNNLDFKAVINIDLETYVSGLGDKLNRRLISEEAIQVIVAPVMSGLDNIVKPRVQKKNTAAKK